MDYRYGLPWNREQGERKRLTAISLIIVPLFLVFGAYVTLVDVPEQDRKEKEALPPQLAKLIVQKKEPPKPVLPEPRPEHKQPEPEEKPEPRMVREPKPVLPQPEPKVAEKTAEPEPQRVERAREKARNSGILAMGSELARLSNLADSVKLDTPVTKTSEPVAKSTPDTLAQRANAKTSSAGVDETRLKREAGQVALAERQRAEIAEAERIAVAKDVARRKAQEVANKTRSKEDLRRTMDANKSAIYSIYNRELRRKPSLRGSITPELVIEENGAVSSCSVVESTLNEPRLERKICSRLRLVDFGARPGVDKTRIRYPIELLPG